MSTTRLFRIFYKTIISFSRISREYKIIFKAELISFEYHKVFGIFTTQFCRKWQLLNSEKKSENVEVKTVEKLFI